MLSIQHNYAIQGQTFRTLGPVYQVALAPPATKRSTKHTTRDETKAQPSDQRRNKEKKLK